MPTKADLAKIHIAKKELGLTDEAYRDLLRGQFKVDSAALLTPGKVARLLQHFQRLGWKPKTQLSLPGLAVPADGQSKKVQALWITLHQAGVVRDGSDQAMLNFVKRLTGRDRLQWCSTEQKSDVIQALKAMAARAGLRGEA